MTTQKAIERSTSNTLPAQAAPSAVEQPRSRWYYSPHADILETADEFTIVLDMPGVAAENVEITCERRSLAVHGRVADAAASTRGEARRAVRTEYGIGDYFRRFELGDTIDMDRIAATYANGVVTVHLPKVEHARPIRISVSEK